MVPRRKRSNQHNYISSREILRELLLSAARAVIRVLPRTKALFLNYRNKILYSPLYIQWKCALA